MRLKPSLRPKEINALDARGRSGHMILWCALFGESLTSRNCSQATFLEMMCCTSLACSAWAQQMMVPGRFRYSIAGFLQVQWQHVLERVLLRFSLTQMDRWFTT